MDRSPWTVNRLRQVSGGQAPWRVGRRPSSAVVDRGPWTVDCVAYWGERIARLGPVEGLRIADELRRQMLLVDPGWPDEAQRQGDLRAHVRVAELLRRAATACRS